jgi:hypothetical protein
VITQVRPRLLLALQTRRYFCFPASVRSLGYTLADRERETHTERAAASSHATLNLFSFNQVIARVFPRRSNSLSLPARPPAVCVSCNSPTCASRCLPAAKSCAAICRTNCSRKCGLALDCVTLCYRSAVYTNTEFN